MSLLSKSKKSRSRPAKNLPISVSAITQPAVENSSSLFSISSFSPRSDLFAFLSLAVDKHRLRVYDAITGQSIAEHIFETSHATSLSWISLQSLDEEEMRRTKRKKRRHHTEPETANPPSQNVCVGLADGSLLLFSPSQGKAIKTLSHPASTSPILAIHHSRIRDSGMTNIWTSSADCIIRLWSLNQTRLLASWKTEERIPYSAITVSPRLPDEDQPTLDVLVANHSIHLLSFPDDNSESTSTNRQEPQKTMTCTGHASAITNVEWDSTSRFVSSAVRDRFLYVWDIPGPSSDALSPSEGRVVASIPLDSDVRSFCLSQPPVSTPSASRIQRLLALSTSGNLLLFSLSSEIISPAPSDGARVVTLKPNATITTQPAKRNEEPRTIQIVAATFIPDNEGKLRVARMTAGVKVSFDIVVRDLHGTFMTNPDSPF